MINPKKNIPLAIVIVLIVVTILYCGLSGVLTLMIPYHILGELIFSYLILSLFIFIFFTIFLSVSSLTNTITITHTHTHLQNKKDAATPLPQAFEYVHYEWARYLVSAGAIISLATCLYASMFPLPRIIYSMSADGLIFGVFSKVLPKLRTPWVACLFSGCIAGNSFYIYIIRVTTTYRILKSLLISFINIKGLFASILNLDELVDMVTTLYSSSSSSSLLLLNTYFSFHRCPSAL